MACRIAYEVFLDVPKPSKAQQRVRGHGVMDSVIFRNKKFAREWQAERKSQRWKIRAVEICDDKIKRRGKRAFTGRRRK
jgi:hypothetical protein